MNRIVLFLFLLATASACSVTRTMIEPCEPEIPDRPSERLLVMGGANDAPMVVVENDRPPGDQFLRTPSLPVNPRDPMVTRLIARMRVSLEVEQGVGIAAPQVGVGRRVILVQRLDIEPDKPVRAYINPRITRFGEETVVEWEGCLSVPAGFGKVKRSVSIDVSYDREDGSRVKETVEGFTSRIFQHEIDHLDGILFIDRKEPGPLMPEKEYREMRKKQKEEQAGGGEKKSP
jgi:peptide deformylase